MLERIAGIVFPIYAIVAIGFAYGRWKKPDMGSANQLNMDIFVPALVFAATGDGGAPSRSAWDSLRRAVELRLAAGALPTRGVESRAARLRARSEVVKSARARSSTVEARTRSQKKAVT